MMRCVADFLLDYCKRTIKVSFLFFWFGSALQLGESNSTESRRDAESMLFPYSTQIQKLPFPKKGKQPSSQKRERESERCDHQNDSALPNQ